MPDALSLAREEFARGSFKAALQLLERVAPKGKNASDERDCLICECLQFKGDLPRALDIAQAKVKEQISPELAARYWGVIGAVRLEQMRREEACEAYRNGMRLAQRSTNLEVLAPLQQLWLIAAGETLGSTLVSAVRDAYQTAARSANPIVLASFHTRLARLEGQRGGFERALHHLALAKSLLDRAPHLGLRALYHVNKACVLAMLGSFTAARKNGEEGTNLAEQAGHTRLAMAGAATTAYIAISSGELSVADSWLRKAGKLGHTIGIVDVPVLENLIALALIHGDTEAAARHVADARVVLSSRDLKWACSNEIMTLFTELHLHRAVGNQLAYADTLSTIRAASVALNDRHSQLLADLTDAKDSFDVDAYDAARAQTSACLTRALQHPMYLAPLARVLARDLWSLGHKSSTRRMLLRACSSALAKGTRLDWAATIREAQDAGITEAWASAYSLHEQVKQAETKFSTLLSDPEGTWFQRHSDVPDTQRDALDGFDDSVGILLAGGDPILRGREALASAMALGIAETGALISHTDAGVRVIAGVGAATGALDSVLREKGNERFSIGKVGYRPLELVLQPKPDLRSQLALRGLRRLLEAANALEQLEKDHHRTGALWQPEVVASEPDGVFSSPQMMELMESAKKFAATTLPVLLVGDTGTGKEVVARAIHRASPRAKDIFLPFNCSAVPRDMIESQLFGYRRGSFTGAQMDFPGVIRSAEGGTLFLDEIGEMSMDLQPKLLRFLETNEVHPLGEGKPIKVDVRVIAATNADLEDLIQRKEFREDLYYRLNIVRFHMPRLAERREEIPPLVMHLLRRYEMDEKKHSIKVSDELMEYLLLYKWPGNVRQLSNELRKMVAMVNSGETLTPEHIAPAIRATRKTVAIDPDAAPVPAATESPAPPAPPPPADPLSVTLKLDQQLPSALEALERAMIEHAIARADGRLEEAARLLGISRKGLFLKRRRWMSDEDTASRSH